MSSNVFSYFFATIAVIIVLLFVSWTIASWRKRGATILALVGAQCRLQEQEDKRQFLSSEMGKYDSKRREAHGIGVDRVGFDNATCFVAR